MTVPRFIVQGDVLPLTDFQGYIAGNWYIPDGVHSVVGGAVPGAGSIRLFPGYIKQLVTLNALGVRIATLSAGGNVQAAIYANNSATMRPTGNPLSSTASMSTAAAASVNAAVSVQLAAGLYWFGTNADNGTVVMPSISTTNMFGATVLGSSSQSVSAGSAYGIGGLSVAQTFGTWPDLTAASFTELTNVNSLPFLQFKVGSIP